MSASYPKTPSFRRTALAPGILGAIVLMAGIVLIGGDGFTIVLYVVAILALIQIVFAYQSKQWWWIPLLAAIAVLWNPVYPLGLSGQLWFGLQYVAAIIFVVSGVLIKIPVTEEPQRR